MATYYGTTRSNYFAVDDLDAFTEAVADTGLRIHSHRDDGLIMVTGGDHGWPSHQYNEDTDEDEDFDIVATIAGHLVDGHVCILQEVGAEKLRYLVGHAVAFNNAGETRTVSISDIPGVEELGSHITDPTY